MYRDKIRVAVVGAGNMGRHHLRNYHEMDEVELVAASDQNPEAKKLTDKYEIPLFQDVLEMIEAEHVEAVSLVVPTAYHFQLAKQLMEAGVHTLVEKPIAATLEEADGLIATAREQKVVLTVGHIERFNPVIQSIKQMIVHEKLGRLSSIICKRLGPIPPREPNTDVIRDLAIHDIDIMQYLLGKPISLVGAHGSRTVHSSEIDSAELLFSANGTSGFSQSNWVTPVKIRTISITGENGYLEADYVSQKLDVFQDSKTQAPDNFSEFRAMFGNASKVSFDVEPVEPLRLELTKFIGAVATGDVEGTVPPEEARAALELALLAGDRIRKEQENGK